MQEEMNHIKADLHIHTTASDGTWLPEILVDKIRDAGITLFAVTDHDTTANVAATAEIAKRHGLGFITGVEVNTTHKGRNYHILGLGIAPLSQPLEALLKRNREIMAEKDEESIQYLEKHFSDVSHAEFVKYANNPARGGWKALNYLIDQQLCRNHKDFFKLLDQWGNPFEKVVFATPPEAIAAIRSAGGLPILAHPGAAFYDRDYQAVIATMIAAGIAGIECFHPDNSSEIIRYCLAICEANHLLVSGGSDCHGEYVPSRCLGRPDIRLSQLKLEGVRMLE